MINYIFPFLVIISMVDVGSPKLTSTFIKTLVQGTCGISTGGPLVQQLTTTLTDTSGLFWSDNGAKIAYVERFGPAFGRYTPNDGRFNRMDTNMGKEAICIFPVNNATGLKFVLGIDNKLYFVNVTGSGTNLKSEIIDLITVSDTGEVFTKGEIDNKGRLWYASASHEYFGIFGPTGHLYKIENLGKPIVMETNLQMGAGMAWTKNYTSFYLVDSLADRIYKYDFDAEKGLISSKTTIFKTSEHAELKGHPYDIVVDEAGYLWIGMLIDGVVIQYDEKTKNILWTISMAVSDVVSLEFGGLDKKTLFVGTSAKLQQNRSLKTAGAGAIFGISGLGAVGIPDNEIVIPEKYH